MPREPDRSGGAEIVCRSSPLPRRGLRGVFGVLARGGSGAAPPCRAALAGSRLRGARARARLSPGAARPSPGQPCPPAAAPARFCASPAPLPCVPVRVPGRPSAPLCPRVVAQPSGGGSPPGCRRLRLALRGAAAVPSRPRFARLLGGGASPPGSSSGGGQQGFSLRPPPGNGGTTGVGTGNGERSSHPAGWLL